MTYSLINVYSRQNGRIKGSWIQDHIGTLETASAAARRTEAVNSNRISVAVVKAIHPRCQTDQIAIC